MISTLEWTLLLLTILVIVYLIILSIYCATNLNSTRGISLNIVNGTKTGSSDIYIMRGNYIYLAQSTRSNTQNGFVLNVDNGTGQTVGQVSYIKNTTSAAITVRGGTSRINVAGLTNTIVGGKTAAYLATDSQGTWMRIE